MSLLSVVLMLVMQYFLNAGSTTRLIINQSEMQDELRVASEIIGDEVERAYYIFPPCGTYSGDGVTAPVFAGCTSFPTPTSLSLQKLNVTWGKFSIVSSGTRFKKPSGGYDWTVGSTTDPILAMISPPKNRTITCTNAANADKSGCFTFVAYFPVKRSGVSSPSVSEPRDFVNADPENNDAWVLMEYRKNLDYNISFNPPYTNLTISGLGTLTSSGSSTDYSGKLNITGFSTVTVPPVYWLDAGCFSSDNDNSDCTLSASGVRLKEPSYDPNTSVQETEGSLPAIQNTVNSNVIASFSARMQAVVRALETDSSPGSSRVLVDYIQPNTGFALDFSQAGAVDQRGVTEVQMKLQGGIRQGGKTTNFPSQPVEVYFTPRNISPQ